MSEEWDFIRTWIEVMDKVSDANRPLKEASGLYVLSTVIGHNAIIPCETEADPFADYEENREEALSRAGIRLNIYAFIIGKSRYSRKTTLLKQARNYINRVLGPEYIVSKISTPEALLLRVSKKNTPYGSHYTWIMDEVGGVLEMCKKREYMANYQSLLQQLYDGNTFTQETKTGGVITVHNPYFTAIISTTPYVIRKRLITEDDFEHGFLNRFLLIYDEGTEKLVPLGDRLFGINNDSTVPNPKARELIEFGKALKQRDRPLSLLLSDRPKEIINEVDTGLWARKDAWDEVTTNYVGNYPRTLLQLAGLYRLSRATVDEIRNSDYLVIDLCDLKRALKFVNEVVNKSFDKIKKGIEETVKQGLDPAERMELVKRLIENYGTRTEDGAIVIKRSELTIRWVSATRRYGYGTRELDEAIKMLVEAGKIEEVVLGKKTPGRPVIFYRLPRNRIEAIN